MLFMLHSHPLLNSYSGMFRCLLLGTGSAWSQPYWSLPLFLRLCLRGQPPHQEPPHDVGPSQRLSKHPPLRHRLHYAQRSPAGEGDWIHKLVDGDGGLCSLESGGLGVWLHCERHDLWLPHLHPGHLGGIEHSWGV